MLLGRKRVIILLNLFIIIKIGESFHFPESSSEITTEQAIYSSTRHQENEGVQQGQNYQNVSLRMNRQQITTCICVPPGHCTDNVSPSPDGSGSIDIRIINNQKPHQATMAPITCNYGLELCCLPGPYRCGARYPPVQGSPNPTAGQAQFGAFPWQVVILTTEDVYLGSGALIDEGHVLTTAHKINNLPLNSYKVRLGEWDAAVENEPIPFSESTVSRVFIHPNFNPNNLQNDIAILRLANDLRLGQTPTIATACLPNMNFAGKRCYVSGWGKDDFGPNGKYQSVQKVVDLQIHTPEFCQQSLQRTRLGPQFIFNSTSFICAGGEAGKDACTGDGGSPLVCEMNHKWIVVGMVAWGIGCGTAGIPGVYVNVMTYIPWIETILLIS